MNKTLMLTATIANGAALSGEIDLQASNAVALSMPSAWTTAALTFLGAEKSGGTFQAIYDDAGTEVTVASDKVVASRCISLDALAAKIRPYRHIKLRSGVAATPVNQGAARTIYVIGRE